MNYSALTSQELKSVLADEKKKYESYQHEKLSVDISRGKPCKEQLDLVMPMLDCLKGDTKIPNNYRNYGMLEGIPEMKKLFADILGVSDAEVLVGGNSSLNMMYDAVQRCMQFGVMGSKPWNKYDKVKFLCPVPGYDRHFAVTEHFGIEMISVPMNAEGPDMDVVETLVSSDESIKGIWCVPKYSNPTGITYSDEVVDRFAKMRPAAADFRIFWDNAYVIHDLNFDNTDELKNILTACRENGCEDRVYIFASTSKITFPGAGVACVAASAGNVKDILSHLKFQTICSNKMNQYAHVQFLKDVNGVREVMRRQAEITRPKFDAVLSAFNSGFGADCDIAVWTEPNGGYFISLDVYRGCAKKVWQLCKGAGLTITGAGATFPYGIDDRDSNIRIAPTFTTSQELDIACEILVCCVKIACIEKILEERG